MAEKPTASVTVLNTIGLMFPKVLFNLKILQRAPDLARLPNTFLFFLSGLFDLIWFAWCLVFVESLDFLLPFLRYLLTTTSAFLRISKKTTLL